MGRCTQRTMVGTGRGDDLAAATSGQDAHQALGHHKSQIPQRGRLWRALVVLGVLAGAVLLAAHLPLCPFALVFRIPCPGCGMTRAAVALMQGDAHRAISLHPLSPVIVPGATALVGYHVGRFVVDGKWPNGPWRGALFMGLLWLYIVAMLGVWVARWFGWFGGPVPV